MALGPMIETPVKRDHPPCIGSYKTTSVKKTIKCYRGKIMNLPLNCILITVPVVAKVCETA